MVRLGGVLEIQKIELELDRSWTPLEFVLKTPHPVFLGPREHSYMKKNVRARQNQVGRSFLFAFLEPANIRPNWTAFRPIPGISRLFQAARAAREREGLGALPRRQDGS